MFAEEENLAVGRSVMTTPSFRPLACSERSGIEHYRVTQRNVLTAVD